MQPLSHRDRRFMIAWSAAHGLCLGTLIWFASYLTIGIALNDLWAVGLVLFLGLNGASIVQQALLLFDRQLHAWLWFASTLCAWVIVAQVGVFSEDVSLAFVGRNLLFGEFEFPFVPIFCALAIGVVFGGIQMLGCAELRRQPTVWPIATGLAFAAVVLILPAQRYYSIHSRIAAYLVGCAAGIVFGAITGIALLQVRTAIADERV